MFTILHIIQPYYKLGIQSQLSPACQALFMAIVEIMNDAFFPDELHIQTKELAEISGLSRANLHKTRNKLCDYRYNGAPIISFDANSGNYSLNLSLFEQLYDSIQDKNHKRQRRSNNTRVNKKAMNDMPIEHTPAELLLNKPQEKILERSKLLNAIKNRYNPTVFPPSADIERLLNMYDLDAIVDAISRMPIQLNGGYNPFNFINKVEIWLKNPNWGCSQQSSHGNELKKSVYDPVGISSETRESTGKWEPRPVVSDDMLTKPSKWEPRLIVSDDTTVKPSRWEPRQIVPDF